jgi:FkbM family methyltransferase
MVYNWNHEMGISQLLTLETLGIAMIYRILSAARWFIFLPRNAEELLEKNLSMLASMPRRKPGRTHLLGWDIEYVDAPSISSMIRYQVVYGVNDFLCDKPDPFILDCGANVGISTLRFKQLFPEARIIAFEPDPQICEALRRNVASNNLSDVEVVEAAVWTANTNLPFLREGADGGHLLEAEAATQVGEIQHVRAVDLAEYLSQPVDFLKIDIEGAELEVLRGCADALQNVEKMIVEVHYHVDRPQTLASILEILGNAGFQVSLAVSHFHSDPFISLQQPLIRNPNLNADLYPVIYAWR